MIELAPARHSLQSCLERRRLNSFAVGIERFFDLDEDVISKGCVATLGGIVIEIAEGAEIEPDRSEMENASRRRRSLGSASVGLAPGVGRATREWYRAPPPDTRDR
jgi:hypothetical protein